VCYHTYHARPTWADHPPETKDMNARGCLRSGRLGFLTVLGAVLVVPLAADAKLTRAGTPAVSFAAVGPGGMKISGTTSDLTVNDDGTVVDVIVPLANLSTGISLRDKHMRDKYLDVAHFPNAELQVQRASLRIPAVGADATADGQGTFKLHGKSKAVSYHYTAKHDASGFTVTGTVHVNITDYGIEQPSYLGVSVKPGVDVSVSFQAKE
jgi:polyisoprenoid-binding protein YceI